MRKILSLVLAVVMMFSMTIMASAANTTTLTTTVPDAEYILNVPKDQTISFGATSTDIGEITVTDASGFAVGKNLNVTISFDAFKCNDTTTTIPYYILMDNPDGYGEAINVTSGTVVTFKGTANGNTNTHVMSEDNKYSLTQSIVKIDSADWGKALGGTYSSTITFSAEVVVE